MHCLALVVIPADGDVKEHVARLMEPHKMPSENGTDEITGHWDWYQIGGRWTGYLTDYNPEKDEANLELAMRGPARDLTLAVKWPTQWAEHAGDVQSVAYYQAALQADSKKVPYALLLDDGAWIGGWPRVQPYSSEAVDAAEAAAKEKMRQLIPTLAPEKRIVVVDYHT